MELRIDETLQHGIAAHKEGNFKEAELLYRAILHKQPKHPDANHNLGVLSLSLNKCETALPLFKTAIEVNSKIEQFWLSYIDALIKANQYQKARSVLVQGKKKGFSGDKFNILSQKLNSVNNSLSPSQSQLKILLEHYQNGRYDETEKLAISITEQFPNHQFSWKVLGAVLQYKSKVSEALIVNQKAVEINPKDAEAHYNLGNTLKELGQLEEAEAKYREAIKLEPDFIEAHSNLGITLQALIRLEEAIIIYKDAIIINSYYPEVHYNLGNTLKELGQLEEAGISYKHAIALKHNYYEAYSNLGVTLQDLGRLEEAEINYKQALTIDPNYATAHNNLGLTLQELGRLEEAEASYKHAIRLKPNSPDALMNLSIVQDYLNNLDIAIIQLKNLLIIDPDNYGLRAAVIIAIYSFLENDFSTSKKYLLQSSKIENYLTLNFKNERIYHQYLLKILDWHENKPFPLLNKISDRKLYVIGESHALVSHGLHVKFLDKSFLCKSMLIQGCMQWHLGNSIKNKFKVKFENIIKSISNQSDVLLSIGEIDCRLDNGIIKHRKKFPKKDMMHLITNTIENYLNYVYKINSYYKHKIIIQGVPSPNIETKNISKHKILELINLIRDFNIILKNKSTELGFGFLDIHKITDRGDGFSNEIWHLDNIHLSPQGMLEAWKNYSSY